jgi:hypothetical protein
MMAIINFGANSFKVRCRLNDFIKGKVDLNFVIWPFLSIELFLSLYILYALLRQKASVFCPLLYLL